MKCFEQTHKRTIGVDDFDLQKGQINFQKLLYSVSKTDWKTHLQDSIKKYSLFSYKLTKISLKSAYKIYQKLKIKYTLQEKHRLTWYQNELRLFIWFLATSPGVFNKSILQYGQYELSKISGLFLGVHPTLCSYQHLSIISIYSSKYWSTEEDNLLITIIQNFRTQFEWSSIAKQLFQVSNQKFFRTPQKCRERWQNHLDKRKIHGKWTLQQDCLILKQYTIEGKKWSNIAKKIGNTRTQHMIKNRFRSIIRQETKLKKKVINLQEQFQLCQQLLKKYEKLNMQIQPKLQQYQAQNKNICTIQQNVQQGVLKVDCYKQTQQQRDQKQKFLIKSHNKNQQKSVNEDLISKETEDKQQSLQYPVESCFCSNIQNQQVFKEYTWLNLPELVEIPIFNQDFSEQLDQIEIKDDFYQDIF